MAGIVRLGLPKRLRRTKAYGYPMIHIRHIPMNNTTGRVGSPPSRFRLPSRYASRAINVDVTTTVATLIPIATANDGSKNVRMAAATTGNMSATAARPTRVRRDDVGSEEPVRFSPASDICRISTGCGKVGDHDHVQSRYR